VNEQRSSRGPKTAPRIIRSAAWFITLFLIAISVLVAMVAITRSLAPVSINRNAPAVLVDVPKGVNSQGIGRILFRRHLVRSALAFALAARMAGVSGRMRAGLYELSPAMPPSQIAQLIALGHVAEDLVTIPEGFTVAQIARRLARHGMANEQSFLTLAHTQGRTFTVNGWTPPNDNLEGYLFPDTYRVPHETTERQIITQMLTEFQVRVAQPDRVLFAHYPGGLPAAITMASLIEREAEVPSDRSLIASALDNRLKIGMRLQCDATVQYALPHHKGRLMDADLRVASPYNTYLHSGLPPTPIANPGLPSINAALHPATTNYLFYVARPDGRHIFSTTLAQHDHSIALVRAMQNGT
jgi:UPF0755 protein